MSERQPEPDAGATAPVEIPVVPADADGPGLPPSTAGQPGKLVWVALDPRWLRKAVVAILLLFVILQIGTWIFHSIGSFLFLLLLAFLLGIALEPIVGFLTRRGMRRGLATGIAMLTFFLAALVFVAVFGGLLVSQISELIQQLPRILDSAADWVNTTFDKDLDPDALQKTFNITPQQIATWASGLAGGVLGVISSTVGLVFQGFTMVLFAFYFSADGPRLRRTIAGWLPARQQRVFVAVWDITVQKTGGFVVSRLLLALVSTLFTSIFLFIIDVPYWFALGLFTGVVSQFIPTVGTYLGIALPCLVAVFNDPLDVVWIIIFGTAYQQIENYFFSPRISSKTLDIHPAIAFGSVIIGAALFGAMGALIGIPLAAAITSIVQTFGRRYELIPELQLTERATRGNQRREDAAEVSGDNYAPIPD